MLVLTRKKDETVHIGTDIVIKVIATGRGKVKLGIEAPAEVRVLRGELTPHLAQTADIETAETITTAVTSAALSKA